jgi:hypothetical protein
VSCYLSAADGVRYVRLIVSLHQLRQGQIQALLDYIDFARSVLKEQISNLSALLPGMAEDDLPSHRLVLETFPCHQLSELSGRPLEELFQFSIDTVDAHRADAVVGPSFDQMFPGEESFYDLDAIMPVQSISQNCASENLGRPSSSAGIDNENPSNFGTNMYPSSPQLRPTLWAGDCEFSLSADATEARNKMMDV